MKFSLIIATTSAIQLGTAPVTRNDSVADAVANHKNQAIAHAIADDQAEHVRHHYGKFTPSGTNYQTWGNESTGGYSGAGRVAEISNASSMNPHGQEVVHTAHNIRNGWTNVVNSQNLRSLSQLETAPVTRNDTVVDAVANHKNQAIAYENAMDQAEHTRHHYGAFTPSGTNDQTWGNQSTGGYSGASRVAGISNDSSMNPHGQEVVHTAHNIRNGWTDVVNSQNLRAGLAQLQTHPVTRDPFVADAAANHKNQAIAYENAMDQAEHTRHHYGAFTPSGTNYQTWGNESTGGYSGAGRVAAISNASSMNPHGQEVVHTSHNIRNGWTNVVDSQNLRA